MRRIHFRPIRQRKLTVNPGTDYEFTYHNPQYRISDDIHNVSTTVSLVFRVMILLVALGFCFYMFGKQFDFYDLYHAIGSEDFAPWDFAEFVDYMNQQVPTDSPVLSTINGLVIAISSIAYVLAFGFRLLGFFITFGG